MAQSNSQPEHARRISITRTGALDQSTGFGMFYINLFEYSGGGAALNGKKEITITYEQSSRARQERDLTLCSPHYAGRTTEPTLVLVYGAKEQRKSERIPFDFVSNCSGDTGGNLPSATLTISEVRNPELWNRLFPINSDGTRWLALEFAVTNMAERWDSRNGDNYHAILGTY